MKFKAFVGEEERDVEVHPVEGGYEVTVDGTLHRVDAARAEGSYRSLIVENRSYFVSVDAGERDEYEVRHGGSKRTLRIVDPLAAAAEGPLEGGGRAEVRAVMPGRVVKLLVEEGAEVERGQGLMVVEAMKMENELEAPRDGTITTIDVEPGQAVESGALLIVIE
jgi:pyruvate carboxylase subunit B